MALSSAIPLNRVIAVILDEMERQLERECDPAGSESIGGVKPSEKPSNSLILPLTDPVFLLRRGEVVEILSPAGVVSRDALKICLPASNTAYGNVLFLSEAFSECEIAANLIAICAGIDWQNLILGRLSDEEWQRFTEALGILHELKLDILQLAKIQCSDIENWIACSNSVGEQPIILVETSQLAYGEMFKDASDDSTALTELKKIAAESGAVIVVVSYRCVN